MIRAVAPDVGETLTRDDRYWSSRADWLGVPRHTLSALVGAVVAQGRDNSDAVRLLRPDIDPAAEYIARETAGRGEYPDESDLYQDVRPALTALRRTGVRVVVAGNQTVRAGELLRGLGLPVDAVATSGDWGVSKPDPEFFGKVVKPAGVRAPHQVLYVGDHPANDIYPAREAGLSTAHLRRGPWGHLWADDPTVRAAADWSIESLYDLIPFMGKSNRVTVSEPPDRDEVPGTQSPRSGGTGACSPAY
ncbi:HAD-IA family hydrolase [Streptomyces alkaliphilus]|uniref:HAD-IA family hydrolase n=1 Tax=Streptomyces alkaliphilus TaxID=1472722 RepID=A0A7W3Y058_9ACTN|nr:HAD family hydrolase [Streptomyces alkaliphilus]MBB0242981.1 HAD-IA family hydrolase [Streptomyces alkaliphilus]